MSEVDGEPSAPGEPTEAEPVNITEGLKKPQKRPSVIEKERRMRVNKLAQYFRILPCPYPQQIFCYAASLLKWFKLEQTRLETLAAMEEAARQAAAAAKAQQKTAEAEEQAKTENGEAKPIAEGAETVNEQAKEDIPAVDTGPPLLATEETVPITAVENDAELTTVVGEPHTEEEQPEDVKASFADGSPEGDPAAEAPPTEPDEITGPSIALTKPALLRISYANATEKRLAWNLAFATMKYFSILDKILDECSFYSEYPDYKDEEFVVLVTLYDYTARSYQRRNKTDADRELDAVVTEELPGKLVGRVLIYPPSTELFREIEQAVINVAVHFAASVARIRVKEQVGSLRLLLPESWRDAETLANVMPFYAWYNQLLGKQEVVMNWLKANHFTKVNGRMPNQKEFTTDSYCSDVLVFNNADRSDIIESEIVKNLNLIVQDRSSLIALHSLLSFVGSGEEVLFGNTMNSWCGIHLEGLLANKFPTVQPVPQIRMFRQPKEIEDAKMIVKAGAKSTKLQTDDFVAIPYSTDPFKNVRHVFLEASDTRSGVMGPIDYIDCENDDMAVLKDMWTPPGTPEKETRKLELIQQTTSLLKHALKFAQARTVTFLTHSVNEDESSLLVQKVLEYTNRTLVREAEAAAAPRKITSAPAFIIRLPIMQNFTEAKDDLDSGKPSVVTPANTILFPPNVENNGFFMCVFKKETILLKTDEDEVTDGDGEEQEEKIKKKGKKGRK